VDTALLLRGRTLRLQYLSSTAAPCSTEKFRDTAVPPNPQSDCAMTPKYTNRRRGWRSKMNLTTLSTPVGYPEAMSISKVSVVNRINGRGSRRPRGWKQSSPTKYKVRRNFVNFEDFCAARVVPDYSSSFDGVHKPLQVGASRRAIGFHLASGATASVWIRSGHRRGSPRHRSRPPLRFWDDAPHRSANRAQRTFVNSY